MRYSPSAPESERLYLWTRGPPILLESNPEGSGVRTILEPVKGGMIVDEAIFRHKGFWRGMKDSLEI